MPCTTLTIRSADIRPVSVPLRRPVVSKVGRFEQWTVILIDLQTEEGPVGHSYLEPIHDLVEASKGKSMSRPGNGLAWNEQAVKRYRYDM